MIKSISYPIGALIALLAIPSYGQLAVIDPTNLAQNALTAARTLEQYQQMVESYRTQLEQLEEAARQVQALTGPRGMSRLRNGTAFRTARRYAPSSWRDTLLILERGGNPGNARDVRRIMEEIYDEYGIGGAEDYNPINPNDPAARAFQNRRDTTYAAAAISETSYNQTESRVETMESFLDEIERAGDMKAISDLNARIGAENGLLLAELIRLNAIRMQQAAAAETQRMADEERLRAMTDFESYPLYEIPTTKEKKQ